MKRARLALIPAVLLLAALFSGAADGTWSIDYGPILRAADARSASFLFHARDASGREADWTAGLEISSTPEIGETGRLAVAPLRVTASTDYVAHLTVTGLSPQTRYYYRPSVNGTPVGETASFRTAPELGGRNADFTVAFLADQHTEDRRETTPLLAYAAAARSLPLFWAQLGDVDPGSLDGVTEENRRTREVLQALWQRNYAPGSPQARFARSFPLGLATINDHEISNNYSMNWHVETFGRRASREANTLHDRVNHYNLSIARWWNYFGWSPAFADRLGRAALEDHGEATMAEPAVALVGESVGARVCVADPQAVAFKTGAFVYLYETGREAHHSQVSRVGVAGSCGGEATEIVLAEAPVSPYAAARDARIGVGGRYDLPGHYHALRPYPFAEFFVLDTTSYRGDPHESKDLYAKDDNRATDHALHPWHPKDGARFIYGDLPHGANRVTDGVRSWLGPVQKAAFLEAVRSSDAQVLVIAAGYPLVSGKFRDSGKYYQGRESGFDYATEYAEILSALEATDKLVLWIHGDGHSPQLVRLRKNVYQLQVGATYLNEASPSRSPMPAGNRGPGDLFGGGLLISGLHPDLKPDDDREDGFAGWLDQFHGYLHLYLHPGSEVLHTSEAGRIARGADDRSLEIAPGRNRDSDPAEGAAAREIVGKVIRLRFGDESVHSVVTAYHFASGRATLTLADPVVRADPDEARVLVDGKPWVEARWFDERGKEWRDLSFVLRKDL